MSASFFEELADAQTPAPVKRKLDAAEKRVRAREQAEKDLKEQEQLSKSYRKWRRGQREALLSGPHGKDVRGIVAFLDTMTLSSAPALIELVRTSGWIGRLSRDERHVLLRIVNARIVKMRREAGLPELDDAIWDQPPKAYHVIRDLMEVR